MSEQLNFWMCLKQISEKSTIKNLDPGLLYFWNYGPKRKTLKFSINLEGYLGSIFYAELDPNSAEYPV